MAKLRIDKSSIERMNFEELKKFMFEFVEQVEYGFGNIDESNFTEDFKKKVL